MRAVLEMECTSMYMYVYFSIIKLERQALSLQLQLQQKNHLSSTAILVYSIPSPNYSPRVIPKIVVNMQRQQTAGIADWPQQERSGCLSGDNLNHIFSYF